VRADGSHGIDTTLPVSRATHRPLTALAASNVAVNFSADDDIAAPAFLKHRIGTRARALEPVIRKLC
jgi:hypothetical protein